MKVGRLTLRILAQFRNAHRRIILEFFFYFGAAKNGNGTKMVGDFYTLDMV